MVIEQVRTWFSSSFNPYSSSARPQGTATQAVSPSAYSMDGFYNVNQAASPDGMIMKGLVGGLTGYQFTKAGNALSSQFMLSQAGIGAAISGTVSLVKNVAALSHNQQSASTTVGNVLTDTLQGSASGIGGALGSWGTNKILTAMGATAGNPLIIATVIGGAVGAVALNSILNTEKLRRVL